MRYDTKDRSVISSDIQNTKYTPSFDIIYDIKTARADGLKTHTTTPQCVFRCGEDGFVHALHAFSFTSLVPERPELLAWG